MNYPPIKALSASEFKSWVDSYNANDLDNAVLPDHCTVKLAQSADFVICSDLPRSTESARYLGIETINLTSSHFQEAGLPVVSWNFPKLSVRVWAALFRVAWLGGLSRGSESFFEAKERAKKAAGTLIEKAGVHNRVLLVGHGIMNRLIAKELKMQGWRGPTVPVRKYWDYGVYRKEI